MHVEEENQISDGLNGLVQHFLDKRQRKK